MAARQGSGGSVGVVTRNFPRTATDDGVTQLSLEGVPFDVAAGELLVACQRHYQGMFPDESDPTFRVFAVTGDHRDLVGEYYVEHEWT